ncbi:hypothetical protein TNCV_4144851 [Trichonephila clavipes]|nr:hypothetical protein TNCV_4144851 [Trichonephila clavipes]
MDSQAKDNLFPSSFSPTPCSVVRNFSSTPPHPPRSALHPLRNTLTVYLSLPVKEVGERVLLSAAGSYFSGKETESIVGGFLQELWTVRVQQD